MKMLEYKGYHAAISFDAEDMIFVGEVFGIVDSINFHGSSVDELVEMFHQSIDNYLEMCAHFGKEPNKEFSGMFNVRIPAELHKEASLMATSKSVTLNNFVKTAIENLVYNKTDEPTVIYIIDKHFNGIESQNEHREQFEISSPYQYKEEFKLCLS